MVFLILNPSARSYRSREVWPALFAGLRRRRVEYDFALTTPGGDTSELARRAVAQGAHTVVAVGGDGTINDVVNGLFGPPQGANPLRPSAFPSPGEPPPQPGEEMWIQGGPCATRARDETSPQPTPLGTGWALSQKRDDQYLPKAPLRAGSSPQVAGQRDGSPQGKASSDNLTPGWHTPAEPALPVVSSAVFGVIYTGTSPDFCGHHRIPLDLEAALDLLVSGRRRRVDVCRITHQAGPDGPTVTRVFCTCANFGLGAAVAKGANAGLRRRFGDVLGTLISLVRSLWGFPGESHGHYSRGFSPAEGRGAGIGGPDGLAPESPPSRRKSWSAGRTPSDPGHAWPQAAGSGCADSTFAHPRTQASPRERFLAPLPTFKLRLDGRDLVFPRLGNLFVGKSPLVASGIRLDVDLVPDDGRMYVLPLAGVSRARLFALLPRAYTGGLARRFPPLYGRRLEILPCPAAPEIEYDGDPRGFLPAIIEVLPRALDLIRPPE